MKRILFVGGGNMGGAIALSSFHAQDDHKLCIIEPNLERAKELELDGLEVIQDYTQYDFREVDAIFLAIKPQICIPILQNIAAKVNNSVLWVSIMAGKSIESLKKVKNVDRITRLMPNLPTLINKGMIGAFANEKVTITEKEWLNKCLNLANEVIWVDKEKKIDAITSISGSGPAYVFYFMNAIYEKSISLGFSVDESRLIVNQTFDGSVALMKNTNLTYKEWIGKVKSKKGTTEAGIDRLDEEKVCNGIKNAIEDAYQRAQELST